MQWVTIALFGSFGVLCRYFGVLAAARLLPYPWPTWVVNILGSFLIGGIYGMGIAHLASWGPGVVIGFLGGFTTFSAFSLECFSLLEKHRYGQAALYAVASPLAGILCVWMGMTLGRAMGK